jgi:agmatine deiminase
MVKAVQALCEGETVHINVLDAVHEAHVGRLFERAGVSGSIRFYRFPTNDAWCRDHGAIFVTRLSEDKQELAAIDCEYAALRLIRLPARGVDGFTDRAIVQS